MLCARCKSKSRVLDSRPGDYISTYKETEDEFNVVRRRQCVSCKHRWTTIELRLDKTKRNNYAMLYSDLKTKVEQAKSILKKIDEIW